MFRSADSHVGPFEICDPLLEQYDIPALPFGHIISPNYPQPFHQSYNCMVTVMVDRESWLGIYTGSFSIMPAGACLSSNELQLSTSTPGPTNHLCGVQKGLLFSKYMRSAESYIRLNLKSFENILRVQRIDSTFELNYIGKSAVMEMRIVFYSVKKLTTIYIRK